jgi:NitT/TauT family transport system ATP-binding protein
MAAIAIRKVNQIFRSAERDVVALKDIDLDIRSGEFVCLLGPSGCGKSTLLNAVAGFVHPTSGTIEVEGRPVVGPGPERGMVFQEYALFPWMSVEQNIAFGLEIQHVARPEIERRVSALLDKLQLGEFRKRYPKDLSGGMRQRVAIARAFIVQPDILLADEAFGHLDEVTAAELRETFLALARECGSTAILITHQLEEAIGVGDRVVVFGKSARLLADIHVAQWPKSKYALLREVIQSTLQNNRADPRLKQLGANPARNKKR